MDKFDQLRVQETYSKLKAAQVEQQRQKNMAARRLERQTNIEVQRFRAMAARHLMDMAAALRR